MLFLKGMERAILWLPFIAIPAYAIEYISGVRWTLLDWNISSFLVATIGISGVHSLFTYSMFFRLPEFREWRLNQAASQPYIFHIRMIMIAATIVLLTFLMYGFFYTNDRWMSMLGCIYAVYSTYHSFSQSMGLSQAYTAKLVENPDLNEQEKKTAKRLQISEVKIKRIWLPLQFIASAILFLPVFGFNNLPYIKETRYLLVALIAVTLCAFFYNSYKLQQIRKTNKLWFSFRLTLYAITPGSQSIALIYIVRAIHAFEYWGVYELAMQNSQANKQVKKQVAMLTATLITLGFITIIFRKNDGFYDYFIGEKGSITNWIVSFIAALSIVHVSVHFYLDSLLFRMKNPYSRKWILPLLLSTPKTKMETSTHDIAV